MHESLKKLGALYRKAGWLLLPKAITGKAVGHFFFNWRLQWFLECKFRADPPQDRGAYFWYLFHGFVFPKNIFALRKMVL
jgi:hypothetical protein